MRLVILAVVSLVVQRFFGWPGFPDWLNAILLPMACIVGPQMLQHARSWTLFAVALGLGWDLVLIEEVVGPGAIAWSAAALAVGSMAAVIADRRPRTWAAMGALGAVVVLSVQAVALMPLGLGPDISVATVARTALLTGLWCGLTGWVVLIDLPSRWMQHRARRLR